MSRKLKICHVITRMIIGGAQENTLFSVIGLAEKGHDVTLLTGYTTGPEGKLLDTFDKSKYPNVSIVEVPYLVREINPMQDLIAYFKLKKYFKDNKFDVVHTHSSKAGIVARVAAYDAKIPLVVHTIHGQAFHKYEKRWKNLLYIFLEKFAAMKCHKIYAVAQAMIDQCVANNIAGKDKYMVVYSGMELTPFLNASIDLELKKKFGILDGEIVIGTIARLFELKGYEYLIPAAKEIIKASPNTKFLIVGNGIYREKYEKWTEGLGIRQNFIFVGLVNPEEIYKYTGIMDLLIHLSLREGLPRAVVQALASGIPAIGFNLDGTPEVIRHGETGYIVDACNVDNVVKYAKELIKNPNLRRKMGETGQEFVKKNFDWRYMADILEKEYLLNLK